MATHAVRRENRLTRLTALFRPDGTRTVNVGMPGYETPVLYAPGRPGGEACWEPLEKPAPKADIGERHGIDTPETLAAIVREAQAGISTEPWGPPWDLPDGLFMNERDHYEPPQRPYLPEPEPYTPDLCADLADLPVFREALGMRTRCHAGECLCGQPVTGDTWGERMVRAGINLLTNEGAAA